MNTQAILDSIAKIIQIAVQAGPTVVQTVEDAAPFAKAIYDHLVAGHAVTQAQIDALEAEVDALAEEVLQPLPPDDQQTG